MRSLVLRMMTRTVIRYQNKDYRLHLWQRLIQNYRHCHRMAIITAHSRWKQHVTDYILFHFQQTYSATMHQRMRFRVQCIPMIHDQALSFQHRRYCALRITKWYRHYRDRRRLIQSVQAITKLVIFRKYAIEYPLKSHIFISWLHSMRSRHIAIQRVIQSVTRRVLKSHFIVIRDKARYQRLCRDLSAWRRTRLQRQRYLDLQHQQKVKAVVCIQSYLRMCHVRCIFGDITSKIKSIQEMFTMQSINNEKDEMIGMEYDFKELDDTEFILDDSFMDFDLKPLSNPVGSYLYLVSV